MILRIGSDYIVIDDVEIEKYFRDLTSLSFRGDVSYGFKIPNTSKNRSIVGYPSANATKLIFTRRDVVLLSNQGIDLYKGYLRVEQVDKDYITCSFYSGNSEWINLITGKIANLAPGITEYAFKQSDMVTSWSTDNAVIFPLVDTGLMIDRLFAGINYAELHPFVFVKDFFQDIFTEAGLKVDGELFDDPTFNKLCTTSNNETLTSWIENYTIYVDKRSSQSIPTSYTLVTITTIVGFSNDLGVYDVNTSRYTALVDMSMKIEFHAELDVNQIYQIDYRVNGVSRATTNTSTTTNFTDYKTIDLVTDDYVEIWLRSTISTANTLSGNNDVYVYYTPVIPFESIVPDLDQKDLLRDIFTMFNVIPSYNGFTNTVTLNLFKHIRNRTAIDISSSIESMEFDYQDFISEYAKKSQFIYAESSSVQVNEYDATSDLNYGGGEFEVDNGFLEDTKTMAELNLLSGFSYSSASFGCVMSQFKLIQSEDSDNVLSITSVTNSGGEAIFNVSSGSFSIGTIVRITGSSDPRYNGTGVVNYVSGLTFGFGSTHYGTATATATGITSDRSEDVDGYYALVTKNKPVSYFSSGSAVEISSNSYTGMAFGWFIKGTQGLDIDNEPEEAGFQYLLNEFYPNFVQTLNDPLNVRVKAYIKESVFLKLKSDTPIYLNHKDVQGLFYLNAVKGYKSSTELCELDLIRL